MHVHIVQALKIIVRLHIVKKCFIELKKKIIFYYLKKYELTSFIT